MAKRNEVVETVKTALSEVLPELQQNAIDEDIQLKDFGANSIDRMDVIVSSMESLGLKLPMMEFQGKKTIAEIADVLYVKANE